MKLDSNALFSLMSEFHVIGSDTYGGMDTREEDILVGYIYGVLSENPESRAIVDDTDRKVFKFGDYSYIVWFDEVEEPSEEGESYDYVQRVEYEESDEDAFEEEELEEEIEYEDLEEEFEETLYPVAIEGPFTDREIEEKIRIGEL